MYDPSRAPTAPSAIGRNWSTSVDHPVTSAPSHTNWD